MDYTVIDNFLPVENFKKLQSLLNEKRFNWLLSTYVANENDNSDIYFVHQFYDDYKIISDFWDLFGLFAEKLNANAFMRCKANLYVRNTYLIEHGKHVDYEFSHKGAILYLNTNNGFTRLSNDIVINSVANRVLFFDPSIPHNSTNCTDAPFRALLTANYF